jgi:hypothetical protein
VPGTAGRADGTTPVFLGHWPPGGYRPGATRYQSSLAGGLVSGHGGQVGWAWRAVAIPAVTTAVATAGWQPGRLAVMV